MPEKPNKAGSKQTSNARRPFSPVLIAAVAGLAIVVVAVLAIVLLRNIGPGSASVAQAGTTAGPPGAKVQVLIFSDFM
jgi:hypothetical protein